MEWFVVIVVLGLACLTAVAIVIAFIAILVTIARAKGAVRRAHQ